MRLPSPDASDLLPPDWWSLGLTLRERLPDISGLPREPSRRAYERVEAWRTAHGLDVADRTADRLAALDTDEKNLLLVHDEPPESVAARTARPAWAEFIEQALTAAPRGHDQLPELPSGTAWQDAFALPFRPFVDAATRAATARAERLVAPHAAAIDSLSARFATQLTNRVVELSVRTQVFVMNRERAAGTLTGDTPAARFEDFVRRLCDARRLAEFFHEFPVLARLVGQTCQYSAEAFDELLARFARDREEIAAGLCDGEPGTLVDVTGTGGDPHQHGRSVWMLRFAEGRAVVYKPRPMGVHERFGELVGWLNDRVPDLGLRTAKVLVRPDYGWTEFIESRPCRDVAEVSRFYRRQGALLALLHAIGGTDMHCENVVACGDQPVVVDAETMFHPELPAGGADTDPAAHYLRRSVHRTALLPQMIFGEHGALDISGLGGDRGATYPSASVHWADAGTDKMRLIRVPGEFPGSGNRPLLDGEESEPADNLPALIAGFRAGYRAIMTGRDHLTRPDGLLRGMADEMVRVLIRPTRLYATLLDESTHPDLLRDALDRDRIFDLLWADQEAAIEHRHLIGAEMADLWAGDIPMFTTRPGSLDVWAADGRRFPGLFSTSSLAAALAKIASMDGVDLRDQEWTIRATLATRPGPVSHHSTETLAGATATGPMTRQHLLAAASGIADQIVASAMRRDGRTNWLGIELVDDQYWQLLPMGAGLGEGYCGVAVFLAEMALLTGLSRYHGTATEAVRALPGLVKTLTAHPEVAGAAGCGGHLGLGGVSYALARLAVLLDDPTLLDLLADLLKVVPHGEPESPRGVAVGLAGGLAAMQAVHEMTGMATAGRLAEGYAARLTAPGKAGPGGATGFARGEAGVGWALLRYASAHDDRDLAAAGHAALAADLARDVSDIGWCGGVAGTILARARDEDTLRQFGGPDECARLLTARPMLRNMSICHGEAGVLDALCALAGYSDNASAARTARAGEVLATIEQSGAGCGTPNVQSSPNLLTGLSGIGYSLVRIGFADHVPSLLLLETPVTTMEYKQTGVQP
ncbi:type 2 lanthipeptide synthetase LanM family protein [Actinophytocola sp.]|uniref:type 2 lanthipeptide synthetase LanM family protein n=1 Tax=Actinophytocola sp. TaxID=1872138 RepID=UPI002ED2E8E6